MFPKWGNHECIPRGVVESDNDSAITPNTIPTHRQHTDCLWRRMRDEFERNRAIYKVSLQFFDSLQIEHWQKSCSYSQKTLNLTAGKQGELDCDVSKAVLKFGGRAMMGRRSSMCVRGGDGCATNFVRSFVLSLSRENLEKTKDRINSYGWRRLWWVMDDGWREKGGDRDGRLLTPAQQNCKINTTAPST
jgi:hypothetical protein